MKNTTLSAIAAGCSMLALILDGETASTAVREGLDLCIRVVIPSLFPFLFLSSIFTNALSGMSLPILRPFGKICGLPKGMESLLIPSFLGGYPAGAHCVAVLWHKGSLSKDTAERMIGYCNNAGPAFIFGLTATVFCEKWVPWLLWAIQIVSACITAVIFRSEQTSSGIAALHRASPLSDALGTVLKSMAYICGWVILFRILISFLSKWFLWLLPLEIRIIALGLFELTNGCLSAVMLSDPRHRIVLCAALLSGGGLCVVMQTNSVLQGLSIRPYLMGKAVQTVLSFLLAVAVAYQLPLLITPVLAILLYKLRKPKKSVAFPSQLVYNEHTI